MKRNETKMNCGVRYDKGYCYLAFFKDEKRESVRAQCGVWPTLCELLSFPSTWFDAGFSRLGLVEIEPGYHHVSEVESGALVDVLWSLPFEKTDWPSFSMGSVVAVHFKHASHEESARFKLTDRIGGSIRLPTPVESVRDGPPSGIPVGVERVGCKLGLCCCGSGLQVVGRCGSEASVTPDQSASAVGSRQSSVVFQAVPPVYPSELLSQENLTESTRVFALKAYFAAYELYCKSGQGFCSEVSSLSSAVSGVSSVKRRRRRRKRGSRAGSSSSAGSSSTEGSAASSSQVIPRQSLGAVPAREGFCYLFMVRVEYRDEVAAMLGPSPTFERLLSLPPGWCNVTDDNRVSRVSPGRFHVAETGPGLRTTLVCVARKLAEVGSLMPGSLGDVLSAEACNMSVKPYVSASGRLGSPTSSSSSEIGVSRSLYNRVARAATCSVRLEGEMTESKVISAVCGDTDSPVVYVYPQSGFSGHQSVTARCSFTAVGHVWESSSSSESFVFESTSFRESVIVVLGPGWSVSDETYTIGSEERYTFVVLPPYSRFSVENSRRCGRGSVCNHARYVDFPCYPLKDELGRAWRLGPFSDVLSNHSDGLMSRTRCSAQLLSAGCLGFDDVGTDSVELTEPFWGGRPISVLRYRKGVERNFVRLSSVADQTPITVLSDYYSTRAEAAVLFSGVLRIKESRARVAVDLRFSDSKLVALGDFPAVDFTIRATEIYSEDNFEKFFEVPRDIPSSDEEGELFFNSSLSLKVGNLKV